MFRKGIAARPAKSILEDNKNGVKMQENCWPVSKERLRPDTVVRPTIQP